MTKHETVKAYYRINGRTYHFTAPKAVIDDIVQLRQLMARILGVTRQ